jgi:hypothetical protein
MTLPGSLPFIDSEHSDFGAHGSVLQRTNQQLGTRAELTPLPCRSLPADDLLTVPQRGKGLALSSSSSLDATDLFLDIGFEASGEVRIVHSWGATLRVTAALVHYCRRQACITPRTLHALQATSSFSSPTSDASSR